MSRRSTRRPTAAPGSSLRVSRRAEQRSSAPRPWADLDELDATAALATEEPSRRPTRLGLAWEGQAAARAVEETAAGAPVGVEGDEPNPNLNPNPNEGDELEEGVYGVEMPVALSQLGVGAEGDEGGSASAAKVERPVERPVEEANRSIGTMKEVNPNPIALTLTLTTLTLTLTRRLLLVREHRYYET